MWQKRIGNYVLKAGESRMYWIRDTKEIELNLKRGLAWEHGIWNGFDPDKGDASIINGNYSAMWTKESGTWKIKSQLFVTINEK